MNFIDSLDIESWGRRYDAKSNLPRYLGRLIRATTPRDTFLEFPVGTDIYIGGWDGIVHCSKATAYVPEGISLWEIGTEVQIKAKAEGDYQKRSRDPLGYNQKESTFVFVTTKRWRDKAKWEREKCEEGVWKKVIVYDAKNLEEWFNQTGAVVREFAAEIQRYPFDGIQTTDHFWEEYSIGPRGVLDPSIVTVGRENEVAQLQQFLIDRRPNLIAIKASSKEEAIAFIVASVMQADVQLSENFFAKSLIIDTAANFRGICANQHNLFLISRFEEVQILHNGVYRGHHILLPMGGDDSFNSKDIITLPILSRDGVISALRKYPLPEQDAEKITLESGRHIAIVKRMLDFPQNKVKWAMDEFAREVIPALLLGRWDESKDGDKEIITAISGMPYNDYLTKISRWKHDERPLMYQIGTTWRLTSPLDAWTYLNEHITTQDLTKLQSSVETVLRNIRPSFDLEPEQRRMASLYGKESIYSEWLREGLTQSLVLIGVFGKNLKLATRVNPQSWVDSIIRNIFSEAEGKLWASLNNLMPLMAEVSPDAFLDAIDQSLSKEHPEIMKMFEEEPSLISSHSHHTGLLWALEGLAWFPEYLTRVALALGKLAELDPGGSLSNRPIASLRTIFLPWMPQTSASSEERHLAMTALQKSIPDVSWKLMMNILPKYHDVAHPSHKTRWRLFNINDENPLTIGEVAEDVSFYVDKVIDLAGNNEEKLASLLAASEDVRMSPVDREKILNHIANVAATIEQTEYLVWHEARHILSNHRSHDDTDWALPEEVLLKYQYIYDVLQPLSTYHKYKWLFDSHWPEFVEGTKGIHDEQQKRIADARKKAIEEIFVEYGLEALNTLSKVVKEKAALGTAIGSVIIDFETELQFLSQDKLLDDQEVYSVIGFLYEKETLQGWEWSQKIFETLKVKGYSNKALARVLLPLAQGQKLWDFVAQQHPEIESEYWKSLRPFLYHRSIEEKIFAINKLLDNDRGLTAIHEASRFVKDLSTISIVNLLRNSGSTKEQAHFPDFELKMIFDELYQRHDAERAAIAQLEWIYLVIFTRGYRKGPKLFIYDELATNPQFFIDLIKWLYKPGTDSDIEAEIENQDIKNNVLRAEQAYRLLSSWTKVPGMNSAGELDGEVLKNWVKEVRSLADEADRKDGADYQIGNILAQFPEKENIQWPPDAICEIIDSINSKAINNNFQAAVFNKRGFSSKSPFEGGQRERGLATYFRSLHDKIVMRWPVTASLLKGLAKDYENDAIREDQRAQRDSLEY